VRLGVYGDLEYTAFEGALYTDEAVILFLSGLLPRVEELTILGRLSPEPSAGPYAVPGEIQFRPLPHYESVAHLGKLSKAARRSAQIFSAELERLDAVWLFGPHPLSLLFAAIARRRGKAVFLGVRQDFPKYIAGRLPSPLWAWAIPAAWSAELTYRMLARRLPTIVVGEDLARRYGTENGTVLATGFSLIQAGDLVAVAEATAKDWDGPLRLLNVGRLGPEKNPTLLPEILAELRKADDRWRLAIAGNGPLHEAVGRRAVELGVADALDLLGYVPNGPPLAEEYRRSHAFLHVSLTEGLPQVIFEAHAAGLPIVATDVGGVASALAGGEAGLLIPPNSVPAAVEAVERLRDEPELRARLIERGLELATADNMDAQLDRIVEFFGSHLPADAAGAAGAHGPGQAEDRDAADRA
jgi:glycosyltransferase involved in cell wall biosynthesis